MALGFGSKGRTVDNNTHQIDPTGNRPSPDSSTAKEGAFGYDPESHDGKGRRKSRIAGGGPFADGEAELDVGKQMELEATNSIKYRTCSWQKVITLAVVSTPSLFPISISTSRKSVDNTETTLLQCSSTTMKLPTRFLSRRRAIQHNER